MTDIDWRGKLQVFVDNTWVNCTLITHNKQSGQACVLFDNSQMKVITNIEDEIRNKPEPKTIDTIYQRASNISFQNQENDSKRAKRFLDMLEAEKLIKIL